MLQEWLEKMHGKFSLFDTPLMYNFSKISTTADADMRKVFDKTLVQEQPVSAVVSLFPPSLTSSTFSIAFIHSRNSLTPFRPL